MRASGIPCQLLTAAALLMAAPFAALSQPSSPLTIKTQGSFFVGGESKHLEEPSAHAPARDGDITVNQMYVQYQIPMMGDRHVPLVMVHGCCLSSKTWETTPDGRIGWSEYFVRHDRSVYLAEQASRGRSGFDPSEFYEIILRKRTIAQMPSIVSSTHQFAWVMFRFGPKFGEVFADEQFPMQAVGELYKQMIPDLNATLPSNPNPTWTDLAALGAKLHGAVLMAHSESGFFPQRAALIDPKGIKGIVSIETQCESGLTPTQIRQLARVPTLILFGDHLADVTVTLPSGRWTWENALANCNQYIDKIQKAGGDAKMMHLPEFGIKGNSHMLMQDRNNDAIADLVLQWMDGHVESNRAKEVIHPK
jgi:hypothetical protein